MKLETRSVASLIPYVNNARTHDEHQVNLIASSIKEFGFCNPVLIDEHNGIKAGHGRVLAAQKLGITEVPTITLSHLSETQKKAYMLADNRMALDAGWNQELLKLEMTELDGLDFDLSLTGFNEEEIAVFLMDDPGGLTDEDAVPEIPEEPVSKPGDVWILGRHRLVCGDSTDPLIVDKCLNGVTPHLMVTDPPYGVEYDPDWRNRADRANGRPSADRATGQVDNDDNAEWREVWSLFPGDVAYIWHAGNKAHIVAESLEASDFDIRAQIIWAKNNIVIGRGHYHPKHEPCWYAVKKGRTGHWGGSRKEATVWNIDKPMKSETGHGTQKPVECMRRPIINNSSPGQAVYEPFSGSGTTIIAAESEGRTCHAIELNPAYIDVAVKRWQDYTGKAAILESTNKTYSEIANGS